MNSYYLCATQITNLGDLVINKMLVDELCQYGLVFVDTYKIPEEFKKYLLENENAIDVMSKCGISLKRLNVLSTARVVRKNNIRLLTGSPGPTGEKKTVRIAIFRLVHFIFKLNGAKEIKIGNCFSSAYLRKDKIYNTGVDKYYLRSMESVNYLNSFLRDKASYIPDLSCLLYFKSLPNTSKERIIAFNVRSDGQPYEQLKEDCIRFINGCVIKGYEIVLFYQVSIDRQFTEDLYKSFVNSEHVSFHREKLWYDDLSFYSNKKYVVSNRLHSLLLGSTYDAIPVIFGDNAISSAKVSHVFKAIFGPDHHYKVTDSILLDSLNDDVIYNQLKERTQMAIKNSAYECRMTIKSIIKHCAN